MLRCVCLTRGLAVIRRNRAKSPTAGGPGVCTRRRNSTSFGTSFVSCELVVLFSHKKYPKKFNTVLVCRLALGLAVKLCCLSSATTRAAVGYQATLFLCCAHHSKDCGVFRPGSCVSYRACEQWKTRFHSERRIATICGKRPCSRYSGGRKRNECRFFSFSRIPFIECVTVC